MNLQNYKVKNRTKCNCGYEFTIYDMKKLQRIPDNKFYGGAIKHIDEIKCPKCQKETLLLIKQQGQTYIVKDIAQKDGEGAIKSKIAENENTTNKENNEYGNENIILEDTTIEKNEENINTINIENFMNSTEIICPECRKTFKSKSGLANHMKVHSK